MEKHMETSTGLLVALLADRLAQPQMIQRGGEVDQEFNSERPEDQGKNREVEILRDVIKQLQISFVKMTERTITLEDRLQEMTRKAALDAERFGRQVETLQAAMLANTDVNNHGILMWTIQGYRKLKQDAIDRKTLSLFSQPFYSDQNGYKMCAQVFLNGDGMGKNTHLSLFFVVMRGEYDKLLSWPFRNKVTMMLLDKDTGRRLLSDTIYPGFNKPSFKKPTSDKNVAIGFTTFIPHTDLETVPYFKEDAICIKVIVDKAVPRSFAHQPTDN